MFDFPLWRHKCPFSAQNFKKSFYICVQTFCLILWKSNEKIPIIWRFFIKYSYFRCLTPHYDVIKGSKIIKNVKKFIANIFLIILPSVVKIGAIFWKIVIFGTLTPPLWRHWDFWGSQRPHQKKDHTSNRVDTKFQKNR